MSKTIMELELEDNLTPQLKETLENLKNLQKNVYDLENQIKDLSRDKSGIIAEAIKKDTMALERLESRLRSFKANRKGMIEGSVKQDMQSLRELEKELISLEAKKRKINKEEKKEINEITNAINLQRQAIKSQKDLISNKKVKKTKQYNALLEKMNGLISKKKSVVDKREAQEIKKVTDETRKLNQELAKQKNIYTISGKRASRDLKNHREKIKATKRETVATKQNTSVLRKNNAVRRSLGTAVIRHIRQIESLVVAVYGLNRAYSATAGRGTELHRQIESQTAGIAALISANTKLTTQGDVFNNFNEAMKMSKQTVQELKKASVETAATFPELTAVFQQAIGGALSASNAMGGATEKVIENTIKVAQNMTNIASAIGMPMVQVYEEIRSLIEGNTDINSRISKMLHFTNVQIKEAKEHTNGLINLLNSKLGAFEPVKKLETFDRLLARVRDSWDTVVLDGTKELFERYKEQLRKLYAYLNTNGKKLSRDLSNFFDNAFTWGLKIFEVVKEIFAFVKEYGGGLFKAWLIFKAGGLITKGLSRIKKLLVGVVASFSKFTKIATAFAAANSFGKSSPLVKGLRNTNALTLKLSRNILSLRGGLIGLAVATVTQLAIAGKMIVNWKSQKEILHDLREEQERLRKKEQERAKEQDKMKIETVISRRIKALTKTIEALTQAYKKGGIETEHFQNSIKNLNKELEEAKQLAQSLQNNMDISKIFSKEVLEDMEKYSDYIIGIGFSSDFEKKVKKLENEISNIESRFNKAISENASDDVIQTIDAYLSKKKDELRQVINKNKRDINAEEQRRNKEAMSRAKERLSKQEALQKEYYARIEDVVKLSAIKRQEYENKVLEVHRAGSEAYKTYMNSYDRMIKAQKESLKNNKLLKYYEIVGKKQKAWEIKEKQLQKEFKGLHANKIKEIVKEEKKRYLKVEEVAKKSFDEINTYWDNITSSMGQSIEDNFFSYFERGFKDLRGMFKNLGKDLLANFTNPLYRGMSQSLASMLMPGYAGGGKTVASLAKSAGLSLVNGQWQGGGDTDGKPNIIMSSAGEVIQGKELIASMSGGNEILSSLSNLSSANSMLNFLSNPMSALQNPLSSLATNVASPFAMAGTALYDLGFQSLGLGVGGLGAGASSFLTGTGANLTSQIMGGAYQAGYIAGGALAGGAIGGLGGMLGDKLFGADTHASTTGAIGGLLGGGLSTAGLVSGPVGWAITGLAALAGGLFGKTKVIGSGIRVKDYLTADMTLGNDNIMGYVHKQKKGWFSKKDWKNLSSLDEATLRQIEGQIDGIAHLLESAGELRSFVSSKGDFKGEDFYDVGLARGIIRSMITMPETISKEVAEKFGGTVTKGWFRDIVSVPAEAMDDARHEMFTQKISDTYKLWKDYAKSVDKSVFEAMRESLSSMVKTKRDFTEWTLKNDSVGLAKFRASYLKKDAEAIAKSLGVNFASLTAENFLGKYNEAISNTFDPNIINQWGSLSKAFQGATDAQETYTNAVRKSATDLHNTYIALLQSQGKDTTKATMEYLKGQAITAWYAIGGDATVKSGEDHLAIARIREVANWSQTNMRDYINAKGEWWGRVGTNSEANTFVKAAIAYNSAMRRYEEFKRNQGKSLSYTPATYRHTTPPSQYDYYTKYTPQAKLIEEAKKAVGIVGNVTRESLNERYKFFDGRSATSEMISKINSAFSLLENSLKEVAKKLYTLDLNDRLTPFSTKLLSAKNALNITTLTTANLNTALKAVNNTSYKSQDALNEMNKHIKTLDEGLADLIQKAKKSFDELVNKVSQTAMSLSSVYSTSKGVIDSLRGDNSNFVKTQYAHFLKEARHYQELVKKDIYDTKSASKFSEAVSNLSGYVDEYLNKDNFETKHDYELQKSITANQFGEFQKTASVYDKLKEAVDEIKKVKEELKTQSDIQEQLAKFTRSVRNILENLEQHSSTFKVEVAK